MKSVLNICVCLTLFTVTGAKDLHADIILQPTIVGSSFGALSGYSINNIRNQGGFNRPGFPTGYISNVTNFESFTASAWHSTNTNNNTGGNQFNWISASNQTFPGYIDFDLGFKTTLSKVAVWNSRAIGSANVEFFSASDSSFTSLTSLTNVTLTNPSSGTAYVQSQNFALSQKYTRYVRMEILSSYDTVNGRASLGEIAFARVPEPNTALWGMLILGGFMGRRSRRLN